MIKQINRILKRLARNKIFVSNNDFSNNDKATYSFYKLAKDLNNSLMNKAHEIWQEETNPEAEKRIRRVEEQKQQQERKQEYFDSIPSKIKEVLNQNEMDARIERNQYEGLHRRK